MSVQISMQSGYAQKKAPVGLRKILRSARSKDFQEVVKTYEQVTSEIQSSFGSIRDTDLQALSSDYRKLAGGGLMRAALPLRRALVDEMRGFLSRTEDFASLMVLEFQEGDFEGASKWAKRIPKQTLQGLPDFLTTLLLNPGGGFTGDYQPEILRYLGGARVVLVGPGPTNVSTVGLGGTLLARFEEGAKEPSAQRKTNVAFEDTVRGRARAKFCQDFDVVFTNTSNHDNIKVHAPLIATGELGSVACWPIGVPLQGVQALVALGLYGAREIHVVGLDFFLSRHHYGQGYLRKGDFDFFGQHYALSNHDLLSNIGFTRSLSSLIELSGDSSFLSVLGANRTSLSHTYDNHFWKNVWENFQR